MVLTTSWTLTASTYVCELTFARVSSMRLLFGVFCFSCLVTVESVVLWGFDAFADIGDGKHNWRYGKNAENSGIFG